MANINLPIGTTGIMWNGFVRLQATGEAQNAETWEAQKATTTWDMLEDWIRVFYKKDRIVLKNNLQLRGKLGMPEQ